MLYTYTLLLVGEDVDSPAEEVEEITDPEELADIEEERVELETEAFRAERWPAYVKYVDSLVMLIFKYNCFVLVLYFLTAYFYIGALALV